MAFLHNQILRKIVLTFILTWGSLSFYFVNSRSQFLIWALLFVSVSGLIIIWREVSAIFILIFLSFLSAYAFYTFFLQFNLPTWILMLSILVVFGYLFTYTEQRIGILSNKRLIYLVLFSLVILEIFLTLSFFLINPISQSLVISSVCYLFIGFCYTILAKHTDNNFLTYLIITFIVVLTVFVTSKWSGLV